MLKSKIMGAAAIGALALAMAPGAAFADYLGYTDLDEGHWAVDCGTVAWAESAGAVHGYDDGTWRPDQAITRGEAAAVLGNAAGNPGTAEGSEQFADVTADDWYAEAALWARAEGVFSGDAGTGAFRGADPITREQAAKILCIWSGSEEHDGTSLDGFADASSVSAWAEGVMSWAVDEGIVSGREIDGGREVAGQGTATRAEFVTMISKVVDGVMAGVDLTGKGYRAEITWVPEYETVEVPVYEQQWVADVYEGDCIRFYCLACGYDVHIPREYIQHANLEQASPFLYQRYQNVVNHVDNNDCNSPHEGPLGGSWGLGEKYLAWERIDLGTGHYEQVQVGTKTEQHEVGGHWELTDGHWA